MKIPDEIRPRIEAAAKQAEKDDQKMHDLRLAANLKSLDVIRAGLYDTCGTILRCCCGYDDILRKNISDKEKDEDVLSLVTGGAEELLIHGAMIGIDTILTLIKKEDE